MKFLVTPNLIIALISYNLILLFNIISISIILL